MKNNDKYHVECTECGAKMSNDEFNLHDCPNVIRLEWALRPIDDAQLLDPQFDLLHYKFETDFSIQDASSWGGGFIVHEKIGDKYKMTPFDNLNEAKSFALVQFELKNK